jgi:hypothetical protein
MKHKSLTAKIIDPKPPHLPVKQLLLDDENPRLVSASTSGSQDDLLRVLWEEMAVDEVALSIAANGYFKEEPLFVIPSNKHKGKYVVIEGNRRLAAVILLTDDIRRKKIGALELPSISAAARTKLRELPVSFYKKRRQLWQFLGFRHINGPKEWDSFSKAKYVADVYDNFKIPLLRIAERIGDKHATVIRLYRGYKLLKQAETSGESNFFPVEIPVMAVTPQLSVPRSSFAFRTTAP